MKNECEFIVRQGAADDSALIIVSGRVAVCRRDRSSEIEFLLAELDEGEMFDAMAWLTRKPRAAPVVAVEATTTSVLGQPEFDQRLEEHPAAARAMTGGASPQARLLRLVTQVSRL